MNRETFIRLLQYQGACKEAEEWVETTPGSPQELWAQCERGDWMLWLLSRTDAPIRAYQEIAFDAAERALRYTTDPRPAEALRVARLFAQGEVDLAAAHASSSAAYDGSATRSSSSAANAATYAVYAARAIYDSAAASVAYAASVACAAYAASGDNVNELRAQAEIVRKYIPKLPHLRRNR